jgi:hypothetical protein
MKLGMYEEAFQLLRQNHNILSTPPPAFMKLGVYIMPPEPISTAHFIIPFYQ